MQYRTSHKKQKTRAHTTRGLGKMARSESAWTTRPYIVFLVFLFFGVCVLIRLYNLQVRAHEDFTAIATNQHQVVRDLVPDRGEIYLQNKEQLYPAAINREYYMAYVSPRDVPEEEMAHVAAQIVDTFEVDPLLVEQKLAKRDDVFEILKHRLDDDARAAAAEKEIAGVHFLPEVFRYYPGDTLAAQTLGFVGSDGERASGRYGLERVFEKELSGSAGSLQQERDARGGWLSVADRLIAPAEDGVDLVLTMDYAVQYEVERILRETVEKHDADSGSVIVMQPKTGKILAMANEPTFSPNTFGKVEDINVFRNSIVSDAYESGSVFKPITMAIGLDAGEVRPDTRYIDTGSVSAGGYTIRNAEDKVYKEQTMTQVLEESINTGMIYVQERVGNKRFKKYIEDFGFGKKHDIVLPAEAPGTLRNLSDTRRKVEYYTASFGQGITTTPLQLAVAYSALANGGLIMKPQIIEKKIHIDGSEEVMEPETVRRVISEQASQEISEMLRSVVVHGHGKRADVPGYLVGGKTGTAQVASATRRGYEAGQTVGTFAGYAPINNPEFVLIVKIENPKDVIWAESSAAPAFGRIMEYLLQFYEIAPTEHVEYTPPEARILETATVGSDVPPATEATETSEDSED